MVTPQPLGAVEVPASLWRRSARPVRGTAIRLGVSATLLVVGLLTGNPIGTTAGAVVAAAIFLAVPALVDVRLERLGQAIANTDRAAAGAWLAKLERLALVRLFAPHGWVAVQRGRIHLALGDGRAAARQFSEAVRLCRAPDAAELIRAQAHGLIVSGERSEARALLEPLATRDQLGPQGALDLGIALLAERTRGRRALELLETAHEALGDRRQILAALAIALERAGDADAALDLYQRAEAAEIDRDPVADELLKRARKALRKQLARRPAPDKSADGPKAPATGTQPAPKQPKRKRRRDRRRERRERRQAKEEKRRKAKPEARSGDSHATGRGQRQPDTRAAAVLKPEPAPRPTGVTAPRVAPAPTPSVKPFRAPSVLPPPPIVPPPPVVGAPKPTKPKGLEGWGDVIDGDGDGDDD